MSIASAQETGTLKIRFEYGGTPKQAERVNVDKDIDFCGKHDLMSETLVVNQENKGIKNVIVYVYTGRGGVKLGKVPPGGKTLTLANDKCRFEPRVVIAQTGDTLKVTNPDEVSHNANLQFFNNRAQNLMIPAHKDALIPLVKAEPAPIPVVCNIHPWMKANVLVLDHPYAGASDDNGELTISGLPVGKLVFRANHESARIKDVEVDGKATSWNRSRFEIDIKPGENDLGTVVIPAGSFR